ncbi:hemerythrin domain-containing protein [Lacisediminimonas sp.]|uniref:hemerythrin domain-containing protein n=1 Tax=Lacisediminimonas sp. TaxID=3060582 RepID=UPI00272725FC|nr:hemerythrin domain-containing protein [Lacisediminimonas sp.]MDO8298164.1 hemerythrin domain-containing protein [Lacisediminimonas sp.]
MPTSKKIETNALDLLMDDHKNVRKMFKEFERVHAKASPEDKQELVDQICAELMMHTTVEEEIFYPAARAAIEDDDLMNEAEVEHASARDLIEQIQLMDPSDPMYDAKVTVLGEYVDHHVQEEEKEMFPKVKKAKLNLDAIGEEILEAKETHGAGLLAGHKPKGRARGSSART